MCCLACCGSIEGVLVLASISSTVDHLSKEHLECPGLLPSIVCQLIKSLFLEGREPVTILSWLLSMLFLPFDVLHPCSSFLKPSADGEVSIEHADDS